MRGGNRKGAGRPEVSYKTIMVRVPEPCLPEVKKIIKKFKKKVNKEQQPGLKIVDAKKGEE